MTKWLAYSLLALFASAPIAWAADTLSDIKQRGELRWGGDEEGGAPYIYRDESHDNRITGFEVELMEHIARRLGVKSVFKQGDWKNLLNELNQARSFDVACNGIELTPGRLRTSIATIPYFVYELHIFARADDNRAMNWDDLHHPKPDGGSWTVGVLEGTSAAEVMASKFSEHVTARSYGGTTEGFRDVVNHNIDFTVTDTPAATVYGNKFPVKQVGEPIERGYYAIYLRPGDEALRDRIDEILREAISDGTLRSILSKYGLWNAAQESLANAETQRISVTLRSTEAGPSHWKVVGRYWPLLTKAARMTIFLSLVSMPLAVALGLGIALGRLYSPLWLRWIFAVYVEVVRGTPLLLQLLFIYFGLLPFIVNFLPEAWQDFARQYAAVIASIAGLSLNYAAYEAEIYRAGLLAIPPGQTEAALALGMSRSQAIRHIVVPQAFRIVIPPVTNDFINLFKDTAVCSVITVVDLSKMYNIAVNNAPEAFVELALVTAGLYLIMSYPLALVTQRLESKPGREIH
ncbi:MAG: ABC transporter substrate-binding protein/permease [Gemmataceae bacterium]